MNAEIAKREKEAALAATETSLPLFEHTNGRQQDQAHQADMAVPEPATQKPEPVQPQAGSSTPPIPAFLVGKDGDAKKIRGTKTASGAGATAGSHEPETAASAMDKAQPPLATGEQLPPARADIVIWPWLVVMLLVIGSLGFWYKHEAWLDHPWVRSMLINMHLPVEVRDKDWLIIPESVQGHWLKRDDGSQVLIIQGRIENRLYCELPPPGILVQFFDDTGITENIGEKTLPITEPPSMEQVRHAPFTMPEHDRIPVEAQGQRGFFLVLESLPDSVADFTLTPAAVNQPAQP